MPPGGKNPLGHIRFNFFNRLMVFQHDTPDQYLFAHVVRAESHGCMRVQDAAKYAEVLPTWRGLTSSGRRRRSKVYAGSTEQEIQLQSVPIWILLDLSDRLCRRRGQAADAPRPLQPRQPYAGCDQGRARDCQSGIGEQIRADDGDSCACRARPPPQGRFLPSITLDRSGSIGGISVALFNHLVGARED